MRDEAELRGHRRTYIGAMPGRIIQSLRRVGVNNPVMMLDEVDKLGNDFRGDPASALLEILDPAQNNTFRDNYLDLPFDLSKVFFIATANQLGPIPMPLRDRMEIIQLAGYSDREKLNIAKQYLVPRQIKENGLTPEQLEITDDAINLLTAVTRARRAFGSWSEQSAHSHAKSPSRSPRARPKRSRSRPNDIKGYLGGPKFYPEEARKELPPGVATGMAWTEMGGEVLFIEATLLPGGSGLTLTGQLGDVMKESAQAAAAISGPTRPNLASIPRSSSTTAFICTFRRVRFQRTARQRGRDDGVGTGVALHGPPVRSDTAMTGEITLSGSFFRSAASRRKFWPRIVPASAGSSCHTQRSRYRGDPRGRPRGARDHSRDLDQRRSQSRSRGHREPGSVPEYRSEAEANQAGTLVRRMQRQYCFSLSGLPLHRVRR